MSSLPSVLKFDGSGTLVTSFGQGLLIFPHGMHVDRDGNIWVTDGQDDAPQTAAPQTAAPQTSRGAPAAPAQPPPAATRSGPLPGATRGHQVLKFSPQGKLLMTLGKAGGAAQPDYFYQPNDVLVAPNGDIFVSEGHGGANARILKFTKDGKFVTSFGKKGSGPGELEQPHALAMDSRGRLFVGDRSNNRIQIFSQDGKLLDIWPQFSRPSGIYIDADDNLFVADSESLDGPDKGMDLAHPGWHRGIRIGSAKDGSVKYFIPDPDPRSISSAAEGVTAVKGGAVVYGAEVGPPGLVRYERR
jgi:hypothetical protein